MTSRLGPIPHQLGGRTYWDMRCLKNTFMETGALQVREDIGQVTSDGTWEKRNFHDVYNRWEFLYDLGGGSHPKSHWFLSQKAFDAKQAQASMLVVCKLRPNPC